MGSIQSEPDVRDLRIVQLVTGRKQGWTEARIASWAGFDKPKDLYEELARDWPVCRWCGALRPGGAHDCDERPKPKEKQQRKAQVGTGAWRELPPAESAADLFRRALATLSLDVEGLEDRQESLQGRRFVAQDEYTDPVIWFRHHFPYLSDEQWKTLAEARGQDPDGGYLEMPSDLTTIFFRGGASSPAEPLPRLIAVAVLAGVPVEDLIGALHPGPANDERREQIRRKIEGHGPRPGLLQIAQELATALRGGEVKPGQQPRLTGQEQRYSHYIQERRRQGALEEEILRELDEERRRAGLPSLDDGEVRRLGKFDLNLPR